MANFSEVKVSEQKESYTIKEFIIACDTGNYDLVKRMLKADASLVDAKLPYKDLNLYAYNPGCVGFHYAARSGHFKIIKLLIEKYKIKQQVIDHEKWNSLHYSCFNGHFDISKYL